MKVHEKRSHSHASDEEKKVTTRKQKAEAAPKKPKIANEGEDKDKVNGRSNAADVAAEFEKFCRETREHLSIKQMREILEANARDASIADEAVVPRWFVTFIFLNLLCFFFVVFFKCLS